VAINFIPKGTPFSTANTRKFEPVKIGDIVNVEVVSGRIKIDTVAKALKSGHKGDTIPIMYLSSKRIVPAIITGRKRVLVQ
jgi:flagella basal body P-ring formation protein FlgA